MEPPVESVNSFWMVVAIVFAIGAIVGAVVHKLLNASGRSTAKLKERLEQVEAELKDYKANVNSHFSKTSDLVSELTQDYVKVYKHLAEGAQKLGDPKEFTNVLEQQPGKVLISFADEVVPPDTGDSAPEAAQTDRSDGAQPAEAEEVKGVSGDGEDEAVTPESQEHLSETIKEVAEKMKGAESPVEETAVVEADETAELRTEPGDRISKGQGGNGEAAPGEQNQSESRKDAAVEIADATKTQPEQQDSKR